MHLSFNIHVEVQQPDICLQPILVKQGVGRVQFPYKVWTVDAHVTRDLEENYKPWTMVHWKLAVLSYHPPSDEFYLWHARSLCACLSSIYVGMLLLSKTKNYCVRTFSLTRFQYTSYFYEIYNLLNINNFDKCKICENTKNMCSLSQ